MLMQGTITIECFFEDAFKHCMYSLKGFCSPHYQHCVPLKGSVPSGPLPGSCLWCASQGWGWGSGQRGPGMSLPPAQGQQTHSSLAPSPQAASVPCGKVTEPVPGSNLLPCGIYAPTPPRPTPPSLHAAKERGRLLSLVLQGSLRPLRFSAG